MSDGPTATTNDKGHGLPCPSCRVDLVMTERQGIEIDYCPKCRGVWLDRGELDKIIERSANEEARAASAQPAPPSPQPSSQGYYDGDRHDRGGRDYGRGRRHGSFLGRLFD